MNIADLFINIGVKGDGQAKKAFAGVSDSVENVKEMSLEAKAAILGVLYGLQRMMGESSSIGQNLVNFAAFTGMSTKALQQYQYAGLQVGLTNDQMTNTFKGLQKTMAAIDWGQMPEGLREINEALSASGKGAIKAEKKDDIPYLMQKLQQYAQLEKRVGIRNKMLGAMGMDEGMIAAMTRGAFNQKVFNQAPIYSDAQSKRLAKINVGFSNIKNDVEHGLANILEKFGPELLDGMKTLSEALLVLSEIAARLIVKSDVADGIKGITYAVKNPKEAYEETKKVAGAMLDDIKEKIFGKTDAGLDLREKKMLMDRTMKNIGAPSLFQQRMHNGSFVTPGVKPGPPSSKEFNVTQNMNVTFEEANDKNAKKTVNTMKKELHEAYRNIPKDGK